MSGPGEAAHNARYFPLPLTSDETASDALYNGPPSPDPRVSSYYTPQLNPEELGSLPLGAAPPFSLYDGSGLPAPRLSLMSSQHTLPGGHAGSDGTGSLYRLNEGPGLNDSDSYRDNPTVANAPSHVPMTEVGGGHGGILEKKRVAYAAPRATARRKIMALAIIAALLLLIMAIVIPVYFAVIRPANKSTAVKTSPSASGSSSAAPSASGSPKPAAAIVTGGDGSTITMEDGTTFIYRNSFGGYWYWDETDPFKNSARAQSWTPALNETFKYGVDMIRGVNLGGWLNTEPFISPALYESYVNATVPAVDEWTLCVNMAADTAKGGLTQLENHYKTFITEQDFAEIAGAGLNYVRIPLGFWAVETQAGEPFLSKVSWTYFLKAIKWARKYGIRINLDLHSLPGSQNGWNHSGKLGTIGFLNGPMGYANAQRALNIIRVLAEFISQDQYKDVVTMFGIVNEPQGTLIGKDVLSKFYYEAYTIVRNAGGGTGQGHGPYVSIHDAFFSRSQWAGQFPNADRISLDSHPYMCFGPQSADPMSAYATRPCSTWGALVNTSMGSFGLTTAGEFSNAVTDCGLFLNGVNLGTRYEGTFDTSTRAGSCDLWLNWQNYSPSMKHDILNFALASMDALQNYFFWTWKIGNSSVSGTVESPAWSYKLGLENGWMPKDPRDANGVCGNSNPWQPPLQAWQTGGAGAGNIPASVTSAFAWPVSSINNGGDISALPSYTPTGALPTLPVPTFTMKGNAVAAATRSIDAGNGWANPSDTSGAYVPIPTCSYLDPWVSPTTPPPSPLCS